MMIRWQWWWGWWWQRWRWWWGWWWWQRWQCIGYEKCSSVASWSREPFPGPDNIAFLHFGFVPFCVFVCIHCALCISALVHFAFVYLYTLSILHCAFVHFAFVPFAFVHLYTLRFGFLHLCTLDLYALAFAVNIQPVFVICIRKFRNTQCAFKICWHQWIAYTYFRLHPLQCICQGRFSNIVLCHFVTILVHAIKICLIVKYAISEGTLMHKI